MTVVGSRLSSAKVACVLALVALVAAGVIDSYPKTAYASEAGEELVRDYGFKRLSIRDPYAAPLGAVVWSR